MGKAASHLMAVYLAAVAFSVTVASPQIISQTYNRCEVITIDICKNSPNVPYNMTSYPNSLGNNNQQDAGRDIHDFAPIIRLGCSEDIQLFLCSLYAPPCTQIEKPLLPCRDVCESARKSCSVLIEQFSREWPPQFDCSKFPEPGGLCITNRVTSGGGPPRVANNNNNFDNIDKCPNSWDQVPDFVCPKEFAAPKDRDYKFPKVGKVVAHDCGAPCYNMFFEKDEIYVIHWINGILSFIGLLSCLFLVVVYFLDRSRFENEPQMFIVWMAGSFMMVSLIYFIGVLVGDQVACGEPFTDTEDPNFDPERLIRQGTMKDWKCNVFGMGLYLFQMLGYGYFVMLTFSWYKQAYGWAPEGLTAKSSCLHAINWTIAAVLTIANVVLKSIEGDILSGVCFVGLWNKTNLLYFVIIPLTLYLLAGFIFLCLGFWNFIHKLKFFKEQQKQDVGKLEDLLRRIGKLVTLTYINKGTGGQIENLPTK